jgi:mycothiol synthase
MVKHSEPIAVEVAPDSYRAATLNMLRLDPAIIERLLGAHQRRQVDLQGLFHARRGDRLVGASWGEIVPGNGAVCWPACLVPSEPEETAGELQRAVDAYLDRSGIRWVQAVVKSPAAIEAIRVRRAGYQHLADVNHLMCTSDQFPCRREPSDLQFAVVGPGQELRLAELVERTYHGTLDCVRLGPTQPVQDVLRSYRRIGVHCPHWWFLVQLGGQDIGCVLLADHAEHDQSELLYLGIVPEQRGHGWGLQATRHAQWLAGRAGRERLILAVDDTNGPARNVYTQAGFRLWDRQSVYARRV